VLQLHIPTYGSEIWQRSFLPKRAAPRCGRVPVLLRPVSVMASCGLSWLYSSRYVLGVLDGLVDLVDEQQAAQAPSCGRLSCAP